MARGGRRLGRGSRGPATRFSAFSHLVCFVVTPVIGDDDARYSEIPWAALAQSRFRCTSFYSPPPFPRVPKGRLLVVKIRAGSTGATCSAATRSIYTGRIRESQYLPCSRTLGRSPATARRWGRAISIRDPIRDDKRLVIDLEIRHKVILL